MALTRRNFVRAAGLAGAAGSVALLAGCARGAADSGANEPAAAGAAGAGVGPDGVSQVVITMTPSSEPAAGFDPLVGWGAGEHVHEPLIQSTLIATDNNLAFVNDLATDYGCSEDGLTWTFHIREDVMFTDGVPLTAEDVAFTINGIVNGEAAEADLSMVDEARAVDATTCEIAMKRPNNALLYTLAVVGIVPAHAYGPDYGEHPIGSGRYMLEQWDRGQQVILRANPDYYGDAPLMDRVVVLFMEEDASLAAAQSGTADVAYTSAALAGAVPAGYTLLNCASVDSRGISLPCNPAGTDVTVEGDMVYAGGNDVTSDLAVRRALNYGIDRSQMIEHVLAGFGRAAYSVGDGMPWSRRPCVWKLTSRRPSACWMRPAGPEATTGCAPGTGCPALSTCTTPPAIPRARLWPTTSPTRRRPSASPLRRRGPAGTTSTCGSTPIRCCGAGVPTRRWSCSSSPTPPVGATTPST